MDDKVKGLITVLRNLLLSYTMSYYLTSIYENPQKNLVDISVLSIYNFLHPSK
jgi:hypothetical protein